MCSPSPGNKRIKTDLRKLLEKNYEVTMLDNTSEFMVKFFGPVDTPYAGGIWKVRVDLPERYPFKSPSIGFMNKIFHPNIDEASGTVCLDVINQQWTSIYDLTNIFESFLPQLLTYPNATDPLNNDAATLFMFKPVEYANKVKEYVKLYASEEAMRVEENGDGGTTSSDESSMSDYNDDVTKDMEL